MDRMMLLEHLERANEHVSLGEHHVRRQRELIVGLARDGHDIGKACRLLRQFEEMLALHKTGRDRLKRMLGANFGPIAVTGQAPVLRGRRG